MAWSRTWRAGSGAGSVTRDLRDPTAMGEMLLRLRAAEPDGPMHEMYDRHADELEVVARYDANLGPVEKYGDPRLLPPTR